MGGVGGRESEWSQRYSKLFRKKTKIQKVYVCFVSEQLCSTNSRRWCKGKFRNFSQSPLPLDFRISLKKNLYFQGSEGNNAQCGPKRATGSVNPIWGLSDPLYATGGTALKLSDMAPGHRIPSPRGAEATIKRLFPSLWISQTEEQSAHYLQMINSCSRSISGVMKNRTKDMQCSLES